MSNLSVPGKTRKQGCLRDFLEGNSTRLFRQVGNWILKVGVKVSESLGQSGAPGNLVRSGVTVLVPARGGSKGIRKKNLRQVGGESLVGRAVNTAKEVPGVGAIVVSTDSSEIASEALSYGAIVHERSEALSGDNSLVVDLIRNFFGLGEVSSAPSAKLAYSRYLLLLEPTAPLRSTASVSACLANLFNGADSSATMCAARVHPLRVFRLDDDEIVPFVPLSDAWNPRQSLQPVFQMTGGAYGCDLQSFPANGNSIIYGDFRPVFVSGFESVDIDNVLDLRFADYLASSSLLIDSDNASEF